MHGELSLGVGTMQALTNLHPFDGLAQCFDREIDVAVERLL